MGWVQSIDSKAVFVFVGDANAHHLEWLESVSPTDEHGRDALGLCNWLDVRRWFVVPLILPVTDLTLS